MVEDADLVLCMAAEHRADVVAATHDAAARTFTLKELVRVLEQLPPAAGGGDPASLAARVAQADAARLLNADTPLDEDVQDPYGDSAIAHSAIVEEIEDLTGRLVVGLYGADS
jgi:protein-tyrosine phosphatase